MGRVEERCKIIFIELGKDFKKVMWKLCGGPSIRKRFLASML